MHVGAPPRPVRLPPIEWSSPTRSEPATGSEPLTETLLGACLVYVAGIALVVAAFLPWVVSGSIEIDGWHATTDAHVLLGIGIGALVVGTALMGGIGARLARALLFAGAVAVAAISVADLVDAGRVSAGQLVSARPGAGPWLALSAAFVLLAAIWLVRPAVEPAPSGHPPAV
jgi:hypothetical protein